MTRSDLCDMARSKWPPAGSTEIFQAMREILRILAEEYIPDVEARDTINRLAHGDIRAAAGIALEFGVPIDRVACAYTLLTNHL